MTGWRRRAAEYGGGLIAAAGILAALNRLLGGSVDPVAASLLAAAGASILLSVARAWRLPNRLRRDLAAFAWALVLGAVAEGLHAVGVLSAQAFHLILSAMLAAGAIILLTLDPADGGRRAISRLRLAGLALALAAAARLYTMGARAPHGSADAWAMTLVAVAGVVFWRAVFAIRERRHLPHHAIHTLGRSERSLWL
jgi:hypothetical protein